MEEHKKDMCESCRGHACLSCWWKNYRLGRWLVTLLLLAFVFWFGVKVGELKTLYEGQWGYGFYGMPGPGMMRAWTSNGTAPGWNMMWRWDDGSGSSATSSAW